MKPKILVTEKISGPALEQLAAEFAVDHQPDWWRTPEQIRAALPEYRAWIVRNQTKVTAELVAAAPGLEVVGRAGVGLDNIDVPGVSAAGVVVVSTPDQNSISVAELVLAMMFALARKLVPADRDTRAGGWDRHRFTGVELYGKTLGLVGLGRIGFLTALRARALGMSILAHDAYISPDAAAVSETRAQLVGLDELLARSDFVSCHVPLTKETRHLFGYERFCRMKPSAFFLNLARGEVVDEAGLVRALQEKRLAGAGLDVREQEPPGPSPLTAFENVIFTPHTGALTREGQDRVVAAICGDVTSVLRGAPARNFVNFSRPRGRPA